MLDALIEQGAEVSYGCRSGVCRSCTLVALEGTVPASAQVDLSPAERRQGLFLPCQCKLDGPLVVGDLDARAETPAVILRAERLSERVLGLVLQLERPLDHSPGQFVTLLRSDGLARSYSIASGPRSTELEFHVGLVDRGQMSGWLHEPAPLGTGVRLRGPYGKCCYDETMPRDAPLTLAGVGTGLAPLWGIVRHALDCDHRGPITLYHGARSLEGLYLDRALRALAEAHPQFTYRPSVLQGEVPSGGSLGPLPATVLGELKAKGSLGSHTVFLCGEPTFVHGLRRSLFLAGCSLGRIFADAFVTTPPPTPTAG